MRLDSIGHGAERLEASAHEAPGVLVSCNWTPPPFVIGVLSMIIGCVALVLIAAAFACAVIPSHAGEIINVAGLSVVFAPLVGVYFGVLVWFGHCLDAGYLVVRSASFLVEMVLLSVIVLLIQMAWAFVCIVMFGDVPGLLLPGFVLGGGMLAVACGLVEVQVVAARGFIVKLDSCDSRCASCRYDLSGGPWQRCPECGHELGGAS